MKFRSHIYVFLLLIVLESILSKSLMQKAKNAIVPGAENLNTKGRTVNSFNRLESLFRNVKSERSIKVKHIKKRSTYPASCPCSDTATYQMRCDTCSEPCPCPTPKPTPKIHLIPVPEEPPPPVVLQPLNGVQTPPQLQPQAPPQLQPQAPPQLQPQAPPQLQPQAPPQLQLQAPPLSPIQFQAHSPPRTQSLLSPSLANIPQSTEPAMGMHPGYGQESQEYRSQSLPPAQNTLSQGPPFAPGTSSVQQSQNYLLPIPPDDPRNQVNNYGNQVRGNYPANNQVYNPAYQVTIPANQVVRPGYQVTIPANQVTNPVNRIASPDNQVIIPANQVTIPANQVSNLVNQFTGNTPNQVPNPVNRFTSPDNQVTIPANQGTNPSKQVTIPANQGTNPSKQVTIPANQGINPSKQVTIPANQGINPNQFTIPVSQVTDPVNQLTNTANQATSLPENQSSPETTSQSTNKNVPIPPGSKPATSGLLTPLPDTEENNAPSSEREKDPELPSSVALSLAGGAKQDDEKRNKGRLRQQHNGAAESPKEEFSSFADARQIGIGHHGNKRHGSYVRKKKPRKKHLGEKSSTKVSILLKKDRTGKEARKNNTKSARKHVTPGKRGISKRQRGKPGHNGWKAVFDAY